MTVSRRSFLAGAAVASTPGFWRWAYAAPARAGVGPYGALQPPDANGILLPSGFRSRLLARSLSPVEGTTTRWHAAPDGGATFAASGGGWIYVSNSEAPFGLGGASALRFAAGGEIAGAYPILRGTTANCAGGPTPWGTWLSCEETDGGRVWECDPTGAKPAAVRPAMGVFAHEAVAVDPAGGRAYLTEDKPDGRLYRFTPAAYPSLAAGVLEAAVVTGDRVSWAAVPDPAATTTPTRRQVPGSTPFDGGEGIWHDRGVVWFTTKGDDRVWALDLAVGRIEVVYDPASAGADAPLRGVDNVVVAAPSGDVYVAEDGGNMELILITPERAVAPFLRVTGQDSSEITGPAFDPSGTRLYFSSQRGTVGQGLGLTYEVTGPFRSVVDRAAPPRPTTTLAAAAGARDGSTGIPLPLAGVAGLAGLSVLGALAFRRRQGRIGT